jgi:hypothetical protein
MTTASGLIDVSDECVGTVGLHGLLAMVEEDNGCS